MNKKFNEQIDNFVRKTKNSIKQVFQEASYQVSDKTAQETPVSTGHLLGSWSPSIGLPQPYNFEGGSSAWKGKYKDESIASANRSAAEADLYPRLAATTEMLTLDSRFLFANDVEYAQQAEYLGWGGFQGGTSPYFMMTQGTMVFRPAVAMAAKAYKI